MNHIDAAAENINFLRLILRRLEHHPQITHTNERTFFTDLDFFLLKEKQASKSVSYKQFIFNHSRKKEFVLLKEIN